MAQPPTIYPPAPPQAPPQPKRGLGTHIAVGAVSLAAGIALGIAISSTTAGPYPAPQPAPTVTVTQTARASAPTSAAQSQGWTGKPDDFYVTLKILKRECFGDQGCNYIYRIDPAYVGTDPLPTRGTIEVTYEVTGDEGGPQDNTFTVEGGSVSYDKQETASTAHNSTKLAVKVTAVSYTP